MEHAAFSYFQPTKIIFGSGEFAHAAELASVFAPKILLVTGKSSMRKHGFTQKLTAQFSSSSEVIEYNKISPNPPAKEVDEGAKLCRAEDIDFVIALGGGSAMDAGKAIAALALNGGKTVDYLAGEQILAKKGLPCMCIPSTSGTSSEITRYSVISFPDGKKKGIASEFLHADIALIDPELAHTMPPDVTASTGLDVLAHAVEAHWSTHTDPLSKHNALRAIELVSGNLLSAYKDGNNAEARYNMSLSTIFAGLAFNGPGTTSLHAVSYPLTTMFGLPHGAACAIAMPAFLRFNAEKEKHNLLDIAHVMGKGTVEEAAQFVEELLLALHSPTKLSELGVKESDMDAIVQDAMRPNMKTNPRSVSKKELKELLRAML
ncbi:iron-containing alcohol dehydrogenase [Candidatus Micrarchaeota archaeon]|nr:iron-containing alcohol dehydrogenase [Candidatus Micrarchaeota archaeon]